MLFCKRFQLQFANTRNWLFIDNMLKEKHCNENYLLRASSGE